VAERDRDWPEVQQREHDPAHSHRSASDEPHRSHVDRRLDVTVAVVDSTGDPISAVRQVLSLKPWACRIDRVASSGRHPPSPISVNTGSFDLPRSGGSWIQSRLFWGRLITGQ